MPFRAHSSSNEGRRKEGAIERQREKIIDISPSSNKINVQRPFLDSLPNFSSYSSSVFLSSIPVVTSKTDLKIERYTRELILPS